MIPVWPSDSIAFQPQTDPTFCQQKREIGACERWVAADRFNLKARFLLAKSEAYASPARLPQARERLLNLFPGVTATRSRTLLLDTSALLADIYFLEGDYDRSAYWLRRCIAIDDTRPDFWLNLAIVLEQGGRRNEAIAAARSYEKAKARNKKDF